MSSLPELCTKIRDISKTFSSPPLPLADVGLPLRKGNPVVISRERNHRQIELLPIIPECTPMEKKINNK